MELKYDFNRTNLINFLMNNILSTNAYKKMKYLTPAILILSTYLPFLPFLPLFLKNDPIVVIGCELVVLFLFLFQKKLILTVYKNIFFLFYKYNKNSIVYFNFTLQLDNDILYYSSTSKDNKKKLREIKYKYSDINKIYYINSYTFLIIKNKFILIPPSAFTSKEHEKSFINMIEYYSKLKAINSFPKNINCLMS